jgi:selenocysteine lyase/cysteine desulfurase
MAAVEQHEDRLFDVLVEGLRALPAVTLHGRPAHHTPTALFSVRGRDPREVYEHLATRDVNAPAGSFYAIEASRWMGLGDAGAVRAGLAPYTDEGDVQRLLSGVAELCA